MGHKTLIDGAAYDIGGGNMLKEGTSYAVKDGKVLVDGAEYELGFTLDPGMADLWSTDDTMSNEWVSCIAYADGYWVLGGVHYGGATYTSRIAYATSLEGPWTVKDFWTNSSASPILGVAHANGYWVICGGRYSGSGYTYYASIAYTTRPDFEWETKVLWSASTSNAIPTCIVYENGMWVVGGVRRSSSNQNCFARYAYAFAPDGDWTIKDIIGSSGESKVTGIAYGNGVWVASMITSSYYASVAYTTDLAGSWTVENLYGSGSSVRGYTTGVIYADGKFIVSGGYRSGSNYFARIWHSTDLSSWPWVDVWGYSSTEGSIAMSVCAHDGTIVVAGQYDTSGYYSARIAYAQTLDGPWSILDVWATGRYAQNRVECAASVGGYLVLGGHYNERKTARIAYSPTIEGFSEL